MDDRLLHSVTTVGRFSRERKRAPTESDDVTFYSFMSCSPSSSLGSPQARPQEHEPIATAPRHANRPQALSAPAVARLRLSRGCNRHAPLPCCHDDPG
jgi:hypothetical protein